MEEFDFCMNCNKDFEENFEAESRYGRRRITLTHKLQDRIRGGPRKNVTVFDALEELLPQKMVISPTMLLACNYFVCVPCMILLRGAYNKKCDARDQLTKLQDREKEENHTSSSSVLGKTKFHCSYCRNMCQKTSQKYSKVSMTVKIMEDLTVKDALEAILPDFLAEVEEQKKIFLCRTCFFLLKRTVIKQHQSEECTQNFFSKSHPRSQIKVLLGEAEDDYVSEEEKEEVDSSSLKANLPFSEDISENEGNFDEITTHSNEFQETSEDATELMTDEMTVDRFSLPGSSLPESYANVEGNSGLDAVHPDFEDAELDNSKFTSVHDRNSEYGDDDKSDRLEYNDQTLLTRDTKNMDKTGSEDSQRDARATLMPDSLEEAFIENVTFLLKQKAFSKAVQLMAKYDFCKDRLVAAVVQQIKSEIQKWTNLASSSWSATLTSTDALNLTDNAMETLVTQLQQKLPTLMAVLSGSLSNTSKRTDTMRQRQIIQRLLGSVSLILAEQKSPSNVIQCINSVLMARSCCGRELFSTFHTKGYCLTENDTSRLLSQLGLNWESVCDLDIPSPPVSDLNQWQKRSTGTDILSIPPAKRAKRTDKDPRSKNNRNQDGVQDSSRAVDLKDLIQSCQVTLEDQEWEKSATASNRRDNFQEFSLLTNSVGVRCNQVVEEPEPEVWILYYNKDVDSGAEIVRLLFEEVGVSYKNCPMPVDGEPISLNTFPSFSLPAIKKGGFQLSQTPVICQYLGEEFGLIPDTQEQRAHAQQLTQICQDFIAEAWLQSPAKNRDVAAVAEEEGPNQKIESFVKTRVPEYLKYLEKVLTLNNKGRGYLFGKKVSYADFALLQVLRIMDNKFPGTWAVMKYIPALKSFKLHMSGRPRIGDYLKTTRCWPFV